ncbi:BPSL0761 family protein [Pseudomonas sp. BN414]|uniref:BPSL0761 family protein n=1 Tax=unclassified Pseudomonas TaxID=196821 RepID=UPI002456E93B|nr:BPSL0761 family protein [Pseudomonas sp. BN414]
MTMPHERTRAVIQTHAFLQRLEGDASLNEDIRGMATQLLRHYPSRAEVQLQGLFEEGLSAKLPLSPFFASTATYRPTERWRNRLCRKLAAILLSCQK